MSAEDRVTAALHALAAQADAPVDGESRLVGRLRREHRLRRGGALLGSIAMVVGIAVAAGTISSGGGSTGPAPLPFASASSTPEPSPIPSEFAKKQAEKDAAAAARSPSPAPTYPPPAADVGGPSTVITVEAGGHYGFRDARTGALHVSGNPEGYVVTDVTGLGDEQTFYDASTKSTKGRCGTSLLQRQVLKRPGDASFVTGSDVPGGTRLNGEVESIAISHDGTRLAYAIGTGSDPNYGGCGVHDLRVVDVRSGTTRTWTGSDATLSSLNWAPDDRTLFLHVNGCCGDYGPSLERLDTRAAGKSLDAVVTTVPGSEKLSDCQDGGGISDSASSRTEVFAVQECFGDQPTARLVVLDPVSGRVRRTVAAISGADQAWSLSVTPDGHHVLLSAPSHEIDAPQSNYRIDDGVISQLSTHLDRLVW